MKDAYLRLGVSPVKALLPRKDIPLAQWCVIACDQYTSDRAYWQRVEASVSEAPSALRLIFPECYLEDPDGNQRIAAITQTMETYLADGTLVEQPEGFVLLRRTFADGRSRQGLVMGLDLERYDYTPGAQPLIRCTEGTIESRIPPRLKVRENAPLELPHIMVLIDDPLDTVIGPLWEQRKGNAPTYEGNLNYGMGSILGYHIPFAQSKSVLDGLSDLFSAQEQDAHPMLFAMGDGNHSFATAKAHWERIKSQLSPAERQNHPARFAMCELVNLHDPGLGFEAIHRVVFTQTPDDALSAIASNIQKAGYRLQIGTSPQSGLSISYQAGNKAGSLTIENPGDALAVSILDDAIASYLSASPQDRVDYIHGEAETRALAQKGVGLLLPSLAKSDLFPYVRQHGPLPRKTFSLGEADEKRCYLEARKIR